MASRIDDGYDFGVDERDEHLCGDKVREEGQTWRRLFDEKHLRVEVFAWIVTLHPPLVDLGCVHVRRHDDELLVRDEHLHELEQKELADACAELLGRDQILIVKHTARCHSWTVLTATASTRLSAIRLCAIWTRIRHYSNCNWWCIHLACIA